MPGIIGLWSFLSFIYYKVTIDAAIDDISIIASLLIAIILGAIIFIVSGLYATKLFYINAAPKQQRAATFEIEAKTLLTFLGFTAAFCLIGRLIVFGFSKDLHQSFSGWNGEEEQAWFCLIISIPLIIHYGLVLITTHLNAAPGKKGSFLQKVTLKEHLKLVYQNGSAVEVMLQSFGDKEPLTFEELESFKDETHRISLLLNPSELISVQDAHALLRINRALRKAHDSWSSYFPRSFDETYKPLLGWEEYYKTQISFDS